jgi:acetylglutamate kinase
VKDVVNLIRNAFLYYNQFVGKIIVIKYGGSVIGTIQDYKEIVLMKKLGIHPVIVHGGSKQITKFMRMINKEPKFINGLRVTDSATVEISQAVLSGLSKIIAKLINQDGGSGVGIGGADANMVIVEKHFVQGDKSPIDLGFVGDVKKVNPEIIITLSEKGFIPVIATGGVGEDGQAYNINADTFSANIAVALKAEKLIMVTDKDGILRDENNPSTLIPTMTILEAKELIVDGTIKAGMLPKIEACFTALNGGVNKVHIVKGTTNNIFLEVFTSDGVGTEIKHV